MKRDQYNQQLLDFIQQSPTPFHAVETMKKAFDSAGFKELPEEQSLSLIHI